MISSVSALNFKNNQEISSEIPREKVSGGATGLVALLASQVAMNTVTPITLTAILPAMKKAGEYDSVTISKIHDGARQAWIDTGLAKKGVKVRFLNKVDGKLSLRNLRDPFEMVEKGLNAFFIAKLKEKDPGMIFVPEKDISYALYHELGHAHNYNMGKVSKYLFLFRPISMYAPALIALYGAFSRKSKPEGAKKLTGAQKTNNFIRDNAGKISLALTLPMLIEEGLATKKGLGWAKKYLSPENFKHVKKGNLIAYTSYLITAAAFALGSWTAVKVKDKLIAKKEREDEELYRLATLS